MLRLTGSVNVLTHRAGVLAKVGHDLRLAFGRFSVELEGTEVAAVFPLESLAVEGAVEAGRVIHNRLSDSDKREILNQIENAVLEWRRFPEATFSGTAVQRAQGTHDVSGMLSLHGVTRRIQFEVREEAGRKFKASVELTPSSWGIRPYRALMGALKLEDRVEIELELHGDP
jgi:hypothetical protein